jgi:hypothetical protein
MKEVSDVFIVESDWISNIDAGLYARELNYSITGRWQLRKNECPCLIHLLSTSRRLAVSV